MRRSLRSWWQEGERWYLAVGLANLVLGTSSVLIPLAVAEVYGRSVGAVGLLASLVSLVGVAGSLVWGRLSDAAHRRKPFVILSYAAVGLCFLAISYASAFRQLVLFNMLLNFFWMANASVTVLIVIESRDQATWEKKIGHMNQIGAIGWVGGLALGSVWMAALSRSVGQAPTIRSLFLMIGLGSLAAAFLALRYVPRTVPKFTRRRFRGVVLAMGNFIAERARFAPLHLYHRLSPRRIVRLLTRPEGFRPGTRRFLLATLIAFLALGFFGIPLPLLLSERFTFPSSLVFLFFMIQHVGIVLAYPLAAKRIRRLGNRSVQIASLSIRLLLFGGVALYLLLSTRTPPMPWIVVAFVAYGVTWSYFQLSGVALTSRLAREENRGAALGLYNALAGFGWILAGIGSSLVTEWAGYAATFGVASGLLLISLTVLHFVPDPVTADAGDRPARVVSQPGRRPALLRSVAGLAAHRR
jgi:DHA1 family tetracycline resistance protein-like MFS transporter